MKWFHDVSLARASLKSSKFMFTLQVIFARNVFKFNAYSVVGRFLPFLFNLKTSLAFGKLTDEFFAYRTCINKRKLFRAL